ncbi:MAG TPA: phage tail assembly protein [bacterium]|nr:phage tail assembly protein [bacterium]
MTTIPLSEPLKTGDGRLLKELTVRPPRVKDLKAAQRTGGTAAEQEVALLALLVGLVPEDLDELLVADYKRLQDTFRDLVGDGG